MFCKYCGPNVPSIQMFTKDVCDECATIHGLKDKMHPPTDTQRIIDAARKKVEEKNERG